MVDIQTVGVLMTAASVSVAAFYYVMMLKNTNENRKAQMLTEFSRITNSKEWLLDLHESMNYEWRDFDDFWAKYGHSKPEAHCKWISILNSFGSPFLLLKYGLVNEEMLREHLGPVSFTPFWEKFYPAIKEMRVILNYPDMCKPMEFYYNKWKRA